ncbi:hypothetical protein [Mesobacillus subterraneus]|uniref:DUF4259 domain-containing protein n=1 Tax=Mesobacillus subterraneus TaxID=285983 RepID=A0A3R9FAJ6_9BACI|nr:hypothetical protein [Mesobacillus subterraneus]RSD22317.1 hypothetical protein EJA10_21445 [Mesobacillus subterraneus]
MGTWGVAILSDDLAEEVSFRYKDLLGANYTNEQASKMIIEEYTSELDEDEITVFWLSFALIQWKLGRQQEDVKNKAIQIIEDGTDLKRWADDPKLRKKREAVLLKLKDQLNSPQPPAKKVPARFVADTFLKAGDAISYQLISGDYLLFKVIGIIEQWTGDRYPLFEMCDWVGREIPMKEHINNLELRKEPFEERINKLAIFPAGKRDDPTRRIKFVAEEVRIHSDMEPPYTVLTWKEFDEYLAKNHGIK